MQVGRAAPRNSWLYDSTAPKRAGRGLRAECAVGRISTRRMSDSRGELSEGGRIRQPRRDDEMLARGASPWDGSKKPNVKALKGRPKVHRRRSFAPSGLSPRTGANFQGLAPLANLFAPLRGSPRGPTAVRPPPVFRPERTVFPQGRSLGILLQSFVGRGAHRAPWGFWRTTSAWRPSNLATVPAFAKAP